MVDGVKSGRQIKEAKTWHGIDGIDEMIMDIQQSCFSGVMLAVGRLVEIEKTIGDKVIEILQHVRLFWI